MYYPSLVTEFEDPTLVERTIEQIVKLNNKKLRLLCFALIIWTALPDNAEARFRRCGRSFRPFQRMRCNRWHRPRIIQRPCQEYHGYTVVSVTKIQPQRQEPAPPPTDLD